MARLEVDLAAMTASITSSGAGGHTTAWRTSVEAKA
jgi:hypothetical protein